MSPTAPVVGGRRPLRALLCALTLAALAAIIALPALAQAAEFRLPLIDKTESLGPGITLKHLKSLDQGGWQDEQVLTVHLNEAGVSTNLLTAGAVAKGGPLSEPRTRPARSPASTATSSTSATRPRPKAVRWKTAN